MYEVLFLWIVWGVAGMFLALSAIMAMACIIYPLSILFEGIRKRLL